MKLTAFDTETYLIQTRDKAPKPVCCTWYEGVGFPFITRPDDATTWALWNDPDRIFCGVNLPYDFLVMMRWHPQFIPPMIKALDEGRVIDLPIRAGLLHLATKGGTGYQAYISLADLAMQYLGKDLSASKKGDDIWRLKFGTLDGVPFNQWPVEALTYALDDAKNTYDVCMQLGDPYKIYPTEEAQNQAAVVLAAIGAWGFKVNQDTRGKLKDILGRQIHELDEQTKHLGWTGTGSKARLGAVVSAAWNEKHLKVMAQYAAMTGVYVDVPALRERLHNAELPQVIAAWGATGTVPDDVPIQFPPGRDKLAWLGELFEVLPEIPKTKGKTNKTTGEVTPGGPSTAEEFLELIKDEMPSTTLPDGKVVNYGRAYVDLKHKIKMMSTYIEPYKSETAHPRFTAMVTSGRTGCSGSDDSSGNLQNIPRKDKDHPEEAFRTMFMARPGRTLGTVDYSQLELCTLAATIRVFYPDVRCTLGDAIDNNIDAHCVTGSQIAGVSYEQMLKNKKKEGSTEANARQASKACFSGDTELLTRHGWRRIDSLAPQEADVEVMQYCPHTKKLTFTKPLGWLVTRSDALINITGSFMDQLVTPDHRLLFINKNAGTVAEVMAADAGKVCESSLSVHGGVFNNVGQSSIKTRLAVMVQADGHYRSSGEVSLGFTKPRKIARCKALLEEAGLPYRFTLVGAEKVPTFYVQDREAWCLLDDEKSFLPWHVYDLKAFADELFRWDGSITKKNTHTYFNTKRHDIDCAQTVLACVGLKSAVETDDSHRDGRLSCYKIHWYAGEGKKNPAYCRSSGLSCETLRKPTEVYCLSVPTSWVLTRRNGKVVVSGNCNFGLPGGLGAKAFVGYAKNNYGVEMTEVDARKFIAVWKQTWPEMNLYLSDVGNIVRNSGGGRATAFTINGFTKAQCFYTELANFRFQSLAAEGAKRALWAVWREMALGWYWKNYGGFGYGFDLAHGPLADSKIVNFVHDEIVGEHPEGDAGKAALKRQEQLMVDVMTKTCQNKITIRVEGALSHQWEH